VQNHRLSCPPKIFIFFFYTNVEIRLLSSQPNKSRGGPQGTAAPRPSSSHQVSDTFFGELYTFLTGPEEPPEDTSTHTLFNSGLRIPAFVCSTLYWVYLAYLTHIAISEAYRIRIFALEEYGRVIHEFDPWFNFRATEYLQQNGWYKFFHWYDYMSWSPLGRPVGSTIYPGLQITAVAIFKVLKWMGKPYRMSLNDVCCFIPAWFGSVTTCFLGLLAYECSGKATVGVSAALVMSILPAHVMRSVGGGFDNESIAICAICSTFYFWVRSLRSRDANEETYSWLWGIATGLSYGYMAMAWGGFVFVINMISLHAGFLAVCDFIRGRYSSQLHHAYSLFFVVGTAIAMRVPPVGMSPFKSLEQLSGLLVFLVLQVVHLSEVQRRKAQVTIWSKKGLQIRTRAMATFFVVLILVCALLWPTGFFGPLSSRIRGLFVKHMKTGNPLVDSVSEHQPASPDAFWHYLHICSLIAPLGLALPLTHNFRQSSFLIVLAVVVYFFALKMARLLILMAVPAAALTGAVLGISISRVSKDVFWGPEESRNSIEDVPLNKKWLCAKWRMIRFAIFVAALILLIPPALAFRRHCESMAHRHSNPKLMFKAKVEGKTVIIDDYREAYFWLRHNTPPESRVLAWWDYGYQITGIANRTTIADGNTWNHEHIATIGRCLTSPVPIAHKMIRHLADYVLVWAGGGGDDLAKSPWMARIGNSVYRDICPKDPLCENFGFDRQSQTPTPMMAASLLYNLHSAGQKPGIGPDPQYFEEAHTSPKGLVRIFKVVNVSVESKAFIEDPANRICDAPGSWYCTGQYPPAEELQAVLRKRRSFGQLEDFNKRGKDDDGFAQQYLKRSRGET